MSPVVNHPWRARFYMIAGMIAFSIMSALLKHTATYTPILQQLLFSYAVCLVPLLAYAPFKPEIVSITRPSWWWLLARCATGLISAACAYYAYKHMPLADAIAISYSGPIFAALFAALWFKESTGPLYWTALITGFVGVVLIANPGAAQRDLLAVGLSLASAVMYGFVLVSLRFLTRTERPVALVFYFMLFATIVCSVFQPWVWKTPHGFTQWLPLIVTGLVMLYGQVCMTKATQLAPTTVVVPLSYTAIIFSALWGFLFWKETPAWISIVGTALIILANLAIVFLTSRPTPVAVAPVPASVSAAAVTDRMAA